MAQWVSDNVTEVAILGRWSNLRPVVTVLHVKREEDSPLQSARDVLNNWQDHIVANMCNNYIVDGARFTDHNEVEGATGYILADPAKPFTGADVGASTPPMCSVLIRKVIDSHVGRRAGRLYLPPPAEANVDENGVLAPAVVTSTNAMMATFLTGLDGGGGTENQLVVIHHVPAAPSEAAPVTGLITDPLVASQRRRNRR